MTMPAKPLQVETTQTNDPQSPESGDEVPLATPRIALIINSKAGGVHEDDYIEKLVEAFAVHGVNATAFSSGSAEDIISAAKETVVKGAQLVVCGGGDGTVSAVASQLINTDCVLGILPLGTLNHFAHDVGIPIDAIEAVRVICEGRVKRVDTAEVNGRVFINNSSLGLYPRIVRRREKFQARLGSGKWAAFLWAVIDAMRRYPFLRVALSADANEIVRETPFVFVGNNEYEIERWQIGARLRMDSGLLSLYVTHRKGRLGLLWLAVRALLGRLRMSKDLDALSAREILVETHRPKRLPVATDGEVTLMRTPLRYIARPGSLRVMVPN